MRSRKHGIRHYHIHYLRYTCYACGNRKEQKAVNPEKVSLMQYYIAMPIKRVFRRIKREISDIYRFKICGEWYCDGCDKYHSGRTVRYCINPDLDAVCFRHWKREYFGRENRVYIGRENVTAKYYPALKKRFGVEGMGEPCRLCGQPICDGIKCGNGYVCSLCCGICYADNRCVCKTGKRERKYGKK